MFKNYRKSGWFYWLFVSYAVIIILSVFINLIGYAITLRVLEDEIKKNNGSIAESFRLACDSYFDDLRVGAFSLLTSDATSRLSRQYYSDYDRSVWAAMLISNMQRQNISSLYEGGSIGILFRDKDLFVQNNFGICTFDSAYNNYFERYYATKEKWIDEVFSTAGVKYCVAEDLTKSGNAIQKNKKSVFFIYHIPSVYNNVAVIAEVSAAKIAELTAPYENSDETALITDNDGNVLFPLDADIIGLNEIKNDAFVIKDILGTKYVISVAASKTVPFRYVKLVTSAVYFQKIKTVRLAFVAGFLVCIVLLTVLAYVFSLKHSKKQEKLKSELDKNQEIMRNEALKRMLAGKSAAADSELLNSCAYSIQDNAYAVLFFEVVSITGESDIYSFDGALASFLSDAFSLVAKRLKCIFLIADNYCAAVSGFSESVSMSDIKGFAENICAMVKKELGIDICCNISKKAPNFYRLNEAYEQALEISGLRFLGDDRSVVLYDDIEEYPKSYYVIINKLNRIFSEITSVSKLQSVKGEILEYVRELSNISVNSESIQDGAANKYTEIKEFISQNYNNPLLDINMLSDKFGLNRSWMSSKFKEKIGVPISDYIVQCRIERAKELLKTGKTISVISEEVGFSGKTVYCRAFKKYEGITSNEYRQILLGGNN